MKTNLLSLALKTAGLFTAVCSTFAYAQETLRYEFRSPLVGIKVVPAGAPTPAPAPAPAPVISAVLSAAPNAVSFGEVAVTSSSVRSVSISNQGNLAATLSSISASQASFSVPNTTCGTTLAAGQACSVDVAFTPSAEGSVQGNLVVAYGGSSTPLIVPLSGVGTVTREAQASTQTLTFPSILVGSTSQQSVQLNNTGTGSLSVSGVSTTGPDYSATTTCGATLAPGSSCAATVSFSPAAVGSRLGTLTFNVNATAGPVVVNLTGRGTDDAFPSGVSLLVHADSNPLTDFSVNNVPLTAVGNATVSTSRAQFGAGSMQFDDASDWFQTPTIAAFGFGTGDYTVEGWTFTADAGESVPFDFREAGSAVQDKLVVTLHNTLGLVVYVGTSEVIRAPRPANNVWNHIAVTRQAGVTRLFVNGVLQTNTNPSASQAVGARDLGASARLVMGTYGNIANGVRARNAADFNGNMDEVRITKGFARYVTNFTPATAPFSNPQ